MGSAKAAAPVCLALCLGAWRLAKLDINSDGLNGISGVTETDVIFAATAFHFILTVSNFATIQH